MKKTLIILLAALLAGFVVAHAQTPSEITPSPDTITIPLAEYKELVFIKKQSAPRTAAPDAKLAQIENALKILNDRLATGTNSPSEALKQTAIAVTPPEYRTLVEALIALCLPYLTRYLYALKQGRGHMGAIGGVFLGNNVPVKTPPENPRPNPLPPTP